MSRFRWPRFSVRTLLLAVTILALWLGIQASQAKRERRAVARIVELGGLVRYDWEHDEAGKYQSDAAPPGPDWLRNVIGSEFFQDVVYAQLSFTDANDVDMARVADLPHLETLWLNSTAIGDEGIAQLRQLQGLKRLYLQNTRIGDPALLHLGQLRRLEGLNLGGTNITDGGLHHLQDLTHLISLNVPNTAVTGSALRQIHTLPKLEYINLHDTGVTDSALMALDGSTVLWWLDLRNTRISDAGIAHLATVPSLRKLQLTKGQASPRAIDELKQLRPQCVVVVHWLPPSIDQVRKVADTKLHPSCPPWELLPDSSCPARPSWSCWPRRLTVARTSPNSRRPARRRATRTIRTWLTLSTRGDGEGWSSRSTTGSSADATCSYICSLSWAGCLGRRSEWLWMWRRSKRPGSARSRVASWPINRTRRTEFPRISSFPITGRGRSCPPCCACNRRPGPGRPSRPGSPATPACTTPCTWRSAGMWRSLPTIRRWASTDTNLGRRTAMRAARWRPCGTTSGRSICCSRWRSSTASGWVVSATRWEVTTRSSPGSSSRVWGCWCPTAAFVRFRKTMYRVGRAHATCHASPACMRMTPRKCRLISRNSSLASPRVRFSLPPPKATATLTSPESVTASAVLGPSTNSLARQRPCKSSITLGRTRSRTPLASGPMSFWTSV